jgi:hypothetical protein
LVTRHLLIRSDGDQEGKVVPETTLPLEADLHDALTDHPQLLPLTDLGLGRIAVAGREAAFASGYADLVLLDDKGQLCLVEVKKEGNPDTRRVVAQLLDYAAALWGKTLLEFEQDVLSPYARASRDPAAPAALRDFVNQNFGREDADANGDTAEESSVVEEIEAALAENLRTGHFLLVVVAPLIPEGVQRVLDYMNAQGLRLYGVEVGYFKEGTYECFVPRLAVQPAPLDRTSPVTRHGRTWDEESILQQLRTSSPPMADVAQRIFGWADSRGLRRWYGVGQVYGSCYFGIEDEHGYLRPFSFSTNGFFEIEFGEMASTNGHPAFRSEEARRELQRRLNEIPGIAIGDERLSKYPQFRLNVLAPPEAARQFFEAIDWALDRPTL